MAIARQLGCEPVSAPFELGWKVFWLPARRTRLEPLQGPRIGPQGFTAVAPASVPATAAALPVRGVLWFQAAFRGDETGRWKVV